MRLTTYLDLAPPGYTIHIEQGCGWASYRWVRTYEDGSVIARLGFGKRAEAVRDAHEHAREDDA